LGFSDKDINLVKNYLPKKLASNKDLVSTLLKDLKAPVRKSILDRHPELV